MKIIKEVLVVHGKATNAACRAELVRLSKVLVEAINFWQHITSKNTLDNKIYSATETTNTWVKKIKILLVNCASLL